MNIEGYILSLESRIRDLEAIIGKSPVRTNMMRTPSGMKIGRVKSGSTFPRGGTTTVVRHKVNKNGGSSAISPTKEETVVDPGAISGGPLPANTLVYYEMINGVLTYIGHDCTA